MRWSQASNRPPSRKRRMTRNSRMNTSCATSRASSSSPTMWQAIQKTRSFLRSTRTSNASRSPSADLRISSCSSMGWGGRSARKSARPGRVRTYSPRLSQGAIPPDAVQDDRKGKQGAGRSQDQSARRQRHDPGTALDEEVENVAPRLSFQPGQAHLRSGQMRADPARGGVDRHERPGVVDEGAGQDGDAVQAEQEGDGQGQESMKTQDRGPGDEHPNREGQSGTRRRIVGVQNETQPVAQAPRPSLPHPPVLRKPDTDSDGAARHGPMLSPLGLPGGRGMIRAQSPQVNGAQQGVERAAARRLARPALAVRPERPQRAPPATARRQASAGK